MSDTGDIPQLEELEPLEEGVPAAPQEAVAAPEVRAGGGQLPVVMPGGLPTPAFNPNASKEFYHFLFAGMLILIGCLMPFGPDYAMAGYKTLAGGFWLLVGIGIVWSMWGAINVGRIPSMKWVGLGFLPFIWGIFQLFVIGFDAPAVQDAVASGKPIVTDWGMLFSTMFDREDPDRYLKVGNFFRAFGPGKIFVFFGGLFCALFFVQGIFGGVKEIKSKKEAARSQAAARRKR